MSLRETALFDRNLCSIDEFRRMIETAPVIAPGATHVELGVPVYAAADIRKRLAKEGTDRGVRADLATVLHDGAGLFVLSGAVDHNVADRASEVFFNMIAQQHAEGRQIGDHYAKPGANDRVWNAIEKLAYLAPEVFIDYYSNDCIAVAAAAWLGPNYQISSQINVVNPGGTAQSPHRDYHLGFMTDDEAEQFPPHTHRLSPMLTLQGAVAHCDMPVETGPTMYLPHSQKYPLGYLAWRRPEFIEYFEEHRTQLPLLKGDAVFFNPALFHAAGSNVSSDVKRMANLLQISSCMGRAMETIDRIEMSKAVFPTLRDRVKAGLEGNALRSVATALADGYAFPTNLDNDPPIGGLTPPSHFDILLDSLHEGVAVADFCQQVDALVARRRSR
ncbi:MAG: phytanoyl-CoA dioxygenase family protein [Ilumatobacteraceae bacterium]|nr:phytanoyl-CoA dioxygenase family protein [Ilumatobacteraceae bacterium]